MKKIVKNLLIVQQIVAAVVPVISSSTALSSLKAESALPRAAPTRTTATCPRLFSATVWEAAAVASPPRETRSLRARDPGIGAGAAFRSQLPHGPPPVPQPPSLPMLLVDPSKNWISAGFLVPTRTAGARWPPN